MIKPFSFALLLRLRPRRETERATLTFTNQGEETNWLVVSSGSPHFAGMMIITVRG